MDEKEVYILSRNQDVSIRRRIGREYFGISLYVRYFIFLLGWGFLIVPYFFGNSSFPHWLIASLLFAGSQIFVKSETPIKSVGEALKELILVFTVVGCLCICVFFLLKAS